MPKKKYTGSSLVGSKIEKRITSVEDLVDDILTYDVDNVYPQRILEIIRRSGTATACVDIMGAFVTGDGFNDPNFFKAKINRKGLTPIKLLRLLARDYARYKGFAIHVNYNALFEISEINYLPFEYCRVKNPDSNGFSGNIAISDNWDQSKYYRKGKKKDEIVFIDVYNPDPQAIFKQIKAGEVTKKGEEIGGIEDYKGQVLYFSSEFDSYPLSIIDPVREDAQADHEAKLFKKNNTATNFLASHVVETPEFEDEAERQEFLQNLEDFQGGRKAGKIFHIENDDMDDETPLLRFTKVDQQANDKIFEYTENSSQKNIRTAYRIPPVLIGQLVAGKMGTAQEIKDAYDYYNKQTLDERNLMEETFAELFSHYTDEINPTGDYSIIPLEYAEEEEEEPMAKTIGQGGIQSIERILTNKELSQNQKKKLLVMLFKISEEDAINLSTIEDNASASNTDID